MFYHQNLKTPKVRNTIVEFANFSGGMVRDIDSNIMPIKYAFNTYNFDISDGALKDGLGIQALSSEHLEKTKELVYPQGQIKAAWQYYRYDFSLLRRDDKLILYMSDGFLYYNDIFGASCEFTKIPNSYFSSTPNFLNYRLNSEDVLIVTSPTDEMLVFNGVDEPYRVEQAPKIASMTVHYERLFATSTGESNQIWFSKELDPINWDINLESAGFIEMNDERGALLKVMSFLDYVYVFREFGITRISAYADQTQFFVSHLFTSSGRICKNTVTLCGDHVIFLTSSGLYAFDGLQTYRIMDEITRAIKDIDNAHAVFYNGKYYLACRFDFSDGQKVLCENSDHVCNAVIEYDTAKKTYIVYRGIDVGSFLVLKIGSKELLTFCSHSEHSGILSVLSACGQYYGQEFLKVWQSPYTDLGRGDYIKTLKAICLVSHTPCEIVINADGKVYKLKVQGSRAVTRIPFRLKFRLISISFLVLSSNSYITRPMLELNITK
ncbi:MAG TPA: hypothetical protein VIL26_04330 [Clostridia bacterium]